jgi:CheY-like chemotaxis protein
MALIILAEDDIHARAFIKVLLEARGDDCIDVSNGDDALDALRGNPCAVLLISDINMPASDGRDVMHILRNGPPRFRSLPVILISGMVPEKTLDEKILDAHSRFLKKPFSQQKLFDTMDELLKENNHPLVEGNLP